MSDDENDRSDEDVAYHALFENAQKAIHSSEANQRRSKAIREELEAYIDSTSEMKGSDGNVLIRIPTNFDTIVNSMNRDDLSAETNEEKPWSQYLLLDGLNAEDDKEYNGRYARSFRDTPDVKIKRGLAQIQLLDRQLQEITRANHVENETSSPRADETFITTKHARATGELSPAAKKDAKREVIEASSKKSTNKNSIEKDREQQRLAYLLSIEPDDEKGTESYWDPDLQAANDAIDERLAAFGRWGWGTSTTTEAEINDPADADAETAFNEPTAGDWGNNNNNNNNSNNSKRGRKVDYLHELRAVRLQNERMQRLDALIDTCSNHPIEYQALLPKAPVMKQKQQNQSINSSSSKGSPSRSPHTVRSPLGTAGSSTRRSIISNSNSSVAGDVLAVPDPTEVQPHRVVTYEDIQELLALLSGSAGEEVTSHSKEAFSAGTATSPVASPSSARSYALSHKQQDASFSPHSPSAAATGEGGPNCINTTPASSSSFSSSIRSHGHGMATATTTLTVDIREGIKALVRQHKKDIEALGRLRARYHSNHSNLPAATTTVGHDTQEEEEDEATQEMLAKKISNVSSTNGRTQHSTSDEDDDHGDNKNKNYNDNDNGTRVERCLDWNEEVPTSTINAAHPAVAAAAVAAGTHVGSAKKPRVTAGSSGITHADEHLPPLPPLSSSSSHSTISEEARGVMQSSHFIQSSSSKSQSASLATDYEDTSSSPPRPAAAAAAGATSSVVKKSLRLLPRGPVTAPSSATADVARAAAMAAAAKADHVPPDGLTVFRSINSELERQQLQQHAANGARLVKKIGAMLAAERDPTHHRRLGADGAAGSNNNINHHAHYHHHRQQHHHHRQQHQEHHHHQLQQQSGDPAEHVSPSSARRALKARNVLDSMTSSSSTFSTTNTLGSPSGATATPTTKDASYSNVMRI